jgi:hypothetical protein
LSVDPSGFPWATGSGVGGVIRLVHGSTCSLPGGPVFGAHYRLRSLSAEAPYRGAMVEPQGRRQPQRAVSGRRSHQGSLLGRAQESGSQVRHRPVPLPSWSAVGGLQPDHSPVCASAELAPLGTSGTKASLAVTSSWPRMASPLSRPQFPLRPLPCSAPLLRSRAPVRTSSQSEPWLAFGPAVRLPCQAESDYLRW